MNATHEEWRPVVGHSGYEVSNLGNVRSVDRIVVRYQRGRRVEQPRRGQSITPVANVKSGHLFVRLGRAAHCTVHALVLEAFVGPRPSGLEGCHNNGDPSDNNVSNLRWDSRSSNLRDAVRHGTHPMSSKTHCKNGHEFTPENTVTTARQRRCRACRRIYG